MRIIMKKNLLFILIIPFFAAGCADLFKIDPEAQAAREEQKRQKQAALEEYKVQVGKAIADETAQLQLGKYGSMYMDFNGYFNDYAQLSQNVYATLQKQIYNNASPDISKTPSNSVFNALLIKVLDSTHNCVSQMNSFIKTGICDKYSEPDYASNSYYSSKKANKVSDYCIKHPDYVQLQKKIGLLTTLKKNLITTSYDQEAAIFQKASGFDINNIQKLHSILLSENPAFNVKQLYSLENMKVTDQNQDGIVLAGSAPASADGAAAQAKQAFVYTKTFYTAGDTPKDTVQYTGTYTFKGNRMDAFQFISLDWNSYGLDENNFYFYPKTKTVTQTVQQLFALSTQSRNSTNASVSSTQKRSRR